MEAHRKSILFAALVLGFVWSASAADIHVPGQYEDLQAAIDTAEDGDRILIAHSSHYSEGFLIDGKSITLETASGEEMALLSSTFGNGGSIGGSYAVLHVVGGSNVTLRRLALRGAWHEFDVSRGEPGLRCSSAEVTAIDCEIVGGDGLLIASGISSNGVPGVLLMHGAVATLVNCTVAGGDGWESWKSPTHGRAGGQGILCHNASQLWMTGCEVRGGEGGTGDTYPYTSYPVTSGEGGAGIQAEQIESMSISICQTSVHGGDGGSDGGGGTNEPGGAGITTSGPCSITSMDSTYEDGESGGWGGGYSYPIDIGCGGVWHVDTDRQIDALLGIATLSYPMRRVYDVNCDGEFDVADVLYRMERLEPDDFEPDGLPESAANIASGETHCFRNIVPVGDQDWTRFTLDQSAMVVANANSSFPELDLDLIRFDAEVPVILSSDTHTQAVVSAELVAGDYYLRVGDSGGDGTIINYSLSLSVTPQ